MNKSDRVRQLEAQRCAAMMAGDVETIAAMLDPELVYVHSSGLRDSRDAYLQALREGLYIYENIEIKNSACIETADTVIVSSDARLTLRRKGQPSAVTREMMVLSVWRASGNDWRLLALQATAVS